MITLADVVNAAVDTLTAVENKALRAEDVEARLAEQMRALFGDVHGPGDPLWGLQVDVCRSVLKAGGIPATELAEWAAVQRGREH